jgi:3',5'-cyclic AMP phosphodiesterase CpdA
MSMRKNVFSLAALFLFMLLLQPITGFAGSPFDFAVIGDTRIGFNESLYKKFLSSIDTEKIKTFIIAGDVIDRPGNEDEWKRFLELTGENKAVHIAPGNHDFNNNKSFRAYKKVIDKPPYYSFSLDNTQFLILCTTMPNELSRIAGKQLEWLKGELEKPFKYRIVFLHSPLFPTKFSQGYGLDKHKEERDALHDSFVQHKVNVVFQGHEHLYNRTGKNSIMYVITGGGGARLITSREEYGGYYHYILAKKREEGYVFTVYDLQTGSKKDEFFLK